MTYTALAVVFMLASVAVGARTRAAGRSWPALALAAAIVAAQFALLVTQ